MDFDSVKHVKHTDTDYLSHLQLFTNMQNINSENDPTITNSIYAPQNITHKQSLSDDEIFNKHTRNISLSTTTHDTDDTNESFNADTISPLLLRDVQSATTYASQKKKKQRSRSMIAKGSGHRKHKSILIRQCKDLESQVKIYKDKINIISDEAEELEEEMKREYELRLLHLETKYLREKSEKKSLQNEVDKLRQELTFRREASIGYSTATVATKSPVAAFSSSNSKHQFYDTTNMPPKNPPMMQTYNSNNTMVINTSNNNTPVTSNTGNTNPSFDIIDNQTYHQTYHQTYNQACNETHGKRKTSSVSSHSNSSSSSTSSSSTSSSNSSSESETGSTYASTETNYTDAESDTESTSHETINMEKPKRKYGKRNKKSKPKSKKNQPKIPKKYVHHKNKKPKSFWDNLWGLFGPPNVMCATCSDK